MAGYGNDLDFQTWLSDRGLSLPTGAPADDVLRLLGSDYVDNAYGWKLSCSQKSNGPSQERMWPRTKHRANGDVLPDDFIPMGWVYASYRAAWLEATNPGWTQSLVDATRQTRREKVDSIEREFFSAEEAAGSDVSPGMPSDAIINGMVAPWLCSNTRNPNSLFRVI